MIEVAGYLCENCDSIHEVKCFKVCEICGVEICWNCSFIKDDKYVCEKCLDKDNS